MKEEAKGTVIFCVYVDDCCVIGDKHLVKLTILELEQAFDIKRVGAVTNYVGCKIERVGKHEMLLSQPDLIKKLKRTFKKELVNIKPVNVPARAGQTTMRPCENTKLIDPKEQTSYRSGVGMLLFLIKHSRPDINNAVRELTKVVDGATKEHFNQMLRLIKYIIVTANRKLLLKATSDADGKWKMRAMSDSDFAGDKGNRKSITGYIIYLYGCAVAWKSRAQRGVTLSSTEAEYVAMSEVGTEVIYAKDILAFLGVTIALPITVEIDNIGAIYLAKKAGSSARTKHVDTRYHYVREYIEEGILLVTFVRTDKNDADIFTKNLGKEKYVKHSVKFMNDVE
jgi:hypothetical protein